MSLAQIKRLASVIMLDKDKELLREQKMIEHLEQVPDQSQLLETPNLLLIQHDISTPLIVVSQSYLYESLCFLKDWRWLHKPTKVPVNLRLTHLPVVAGYTMDDPVVRKISASVLE